MKKRILFIFILLTLIGEAVFAAEKGGKATMLITEKPFTLKTNYGEKNNGWGDITFIEGVVIPFEITGKENGKYKIKKMGIMPFNIDKDDVFSVEEKDVREVQIDMSFIPKIDFSGGLRKATALKDEMEIFLKGKTEEEKGFYNYIYIQKFLLFYSKLEKDENAERILTDYFVSEKNHSGYKYIMVKNPVTYDMLLIYKPLILRYIGYRYFNSFTDFKTLFIERGAKSTEKYKVITNAEMELMVKNCDGSLDNLAVDDAYKDILFILGQSALHKIPQIQQFLAKEKIQRLNNLEIYLSIMLKNDIAAAKVFINDTEISVLLRTSLIINLVDLSTVEGKKETAWKVRDELEKNLSQKSGINRYIFQILPADHFMTAVSLLTKEIEKEEVLKMKKNQLMDYLYAKYGEYMGIKEVDKGNQLFMHLLDYYLVINASKYAKQEKILSSDGELLVFSSLYTSLKNKDIYTGIIKEMQTKPGNEMIAEMLSTSLGIITLMEMDNIIYSPIIENEKCAGLLAVYMKKYDTILEMNSTLNDRELYNDYLNKKIAVDFILAKDIDGISRAKDYMWKILTEYPDAAEGMMSYLKRVSLVFASNMAKNNPEYKEILDDAMEMAEKFKK